MNDTADLIYREIEQRKLPKYALAILEKCDRLIAFHNARESKIKTITLFKKDFDSLGKACELRGQEITERTCHGYRLRRA